MAKEFNFAVEKRSQDMLARAGVISTPHGEIKTPAFVTVGTRAAVRGLYPQQVAEAGGQAVLGNAYHLYLRPGTELVEKAGGLGKFMNWEGPTFTDSGGFQVLSLGAGFKKVLSMTNAIDTEQVIAEAKTRLAQVDEEGVTFISHIDGSKHRFTPEISIAIQHQLGADIIFAFDECTTLMHNRKYQEESLARTHRWAEQSLAAHVDQTLKRPNKLYQALFGVVQGAQHEDLRRNSARFIGSLDFDGFGIGGAIEKERLGDIVRWVNEELPEAKPKHLLGISEPSDIFTGIENGADTFDCVAPTREGRSGAIYSKSGRFNITRSEFRDDFGALVEGCDCYACKNYSRAYVHHLFRVNEMMGPMLASLHNVRFTVKLVEDIRASIVNGSFTEFKRNWLKQYRQKA